MRIVADVVRLRSVRGDQPMPPADGVNVRSATLCDPAYDSGTGPHGPGGPGRAEAKSERHHER